MRTGAIVLAGGRGSRLGGVRKADLRLGEERLLDRVLGAVAAAQERVVVGYEDLEVPAGVLLTREEPAFAGPAAGVAAGLAALDEARAEAATRAGPAAPAGPPEWIFTLACDLPGVVRAIPALTEAAAEAAPEVEAISASSDDRLEWLISIHRAGALRRALGRQGEENMVNCSMRRLYSHLRWERVAVPPGSTRDIDTWEDLGEWKQKVERT